MMLTFSPGNSVIHCMDVRYKTAAIIIMTTAALNAELIGLSIFSVFWAAAVFLSKISFKIMVKGLRPAIFLIAMIFISRALFAETSGEVLLKIGPAVITNKGAYNGFIMSFRFLAVVLTSLIFITTTKPYDIKAAAQWFFKPVPFVPEKRVGTMLSLIMRAIPLFFKQAGQTIDAQNARCIENRKNPIYRIRCFCIPVIRRSFETAGNLAQSMEARCYSEERTSPKFLPNKADPFFFLFSLCIAVVMIVFN